MSKVLVIVATLLYVMVIVLEAVSTPIEELRSSELFAATIGAIVWHLGKLRLDKDRQEKKGQPLNFKEHFKKNYDDWVWTIFFVLIVAFWGKEIVYEWQTARGLARHPLDIFWWLLTAPVGDLSYSAGKALLPWVEKQIIARIKTFLSKF